MYVSTEEKFWVKKDWINEIAWNKVSNCWNFYAEQQSDIIIYKSKKFKNKEEGQEWLKKEFHIGKV